MEWLPLHLAGILSLAAAILVFVVMRSALRLAPSSGCLVCGLEVYRNRRIVSRARWAWHDVVTAATRAHRMKLVRWRIATRLDARTGISLPPTGPTSPGGAYFPRATR